MRPAAEGRAEDEPRDGGACGDEEDGEETWCGHNRTLNERCETMMKEL